MKAFEFRFTLTRSVVIAADSETEAREKIVGEWEEITLEETTPNQPEHVHHD